MDGVIEWRLETLDHRDAGIAWVPHAQHDLCLLCQQPVVKRCAAVVRFYDQMSAILHRFIGYFRQIIGICRENGRVTKPGDHQLTHDVKNPGRSTAMQPNCSDGAR